MSIDAVSTQKLDHLLSGESLSTNDNQDEQNENGVIQKRLEALAHMIGERYESDFIAYAGNIGSPADVIFRSELDKAKNHDKVIFWLSTYGGVPDSAYRIARALQSRYQHITIIVDRYCKSSGTLISLAADEIWMTENGELGPLDIQLLSKDEFLERNSGLDSLQALNTLSEQSASLFSQQFMNARMGGRISTKQALDVASRISVGLLSKIYEQIEPLRLGEISRSMRIAYEYGQRLDKGNLKPNALGQLIASYPSHGYVIDYQEAKDSLFNKVEIIDDDLILATLNTLDVFITGRIGSDAPLILKLNDFIINEIDEQEAEAEAEDAA